MIIGTFVFTLNLIEGSDEWLELKFAGIDY